MKLFVLGFVSVLILAFSFESDAHGVKTEKQKKAEAEQMKKFPGEWSLSKGTDKVCPEKIIIESTAKGLKLQNIRTKAKTSFEYEQDRAIKTSGKRDYDYKDLQGRQASYTLDWSTTTIVSGGRLVSNHLWSATNNTWSTVGTKIFGIEGPNKLVMEKAITGYGQEDPSEMPGPEIVKKSVVLFEHPQEQRLRSYLYHCEFSKNQKVALKK